MVDKIINKTDLVHNLYETSKTVQTVENTGFSASFSVLFMVK